VKEAVHIFISTNESEFAATTRRIEETSPPEWAEK
jgi:hypothetical protein